MLIKSTKRHLYKYINIYSLIIETNIHRLSFRLHFCLLKFSTIFNLSTEKKINKSNIIKYIR